MNLLAPNGNQTNLTKEQYFLVRTPEFKQWFGDWEKLALTKINDSGIDEISLKRLEDGVSKVVDENGEPLVCRHYSQKPNKFNEFTKQKPNDTRNFISFAKEGFYFSTANKYSIEKIYNRSKKGLLYEVFLNIKNILDLGNYNAYDFITKKAVNWKEFTFEMLQKYVIKGRIGSFDDYTEYNVNVNAFWIDEIDEKAKNKILKLGYKGVWGDKDKYADSISDEFYGTDQIVVFDSNQIKLADGSNTTFDSNNPDIRFEDGGLIDFTFEQLPDDYKEFYQIRGFKNLNDEKYYFSRLNTHTEKNVFTIETEDGKEIARATLNENGNYLTNIRVDENYRRKGLASNLYNFIEKVTNSNLKPSPDKISNEAKNLWMKRNLDIRFEDGGEITPYISDDFQIGYNGAYEHLLAPNGELSKLTPEQYKLVRTPEFKAWFGDWENDPENASKVVDENGEPLVCYHGTDVKFNSFNKDFIGSNFKLDKIGFFFTSSYNSANMSRPSYPQKSKFRWTDEDKLNAKGGFIISAFLNIRKPLRINEVNNVIYDNGVSAINTFDHNREVITESILTLKKDGFILKKEGEYILVATEPNQIKLADGTNTTFNGNNTDIRFEKGGLVQLYQSNPEIFIKKNSIIGTTDINYDLFGTKAHVQFFGEPMGIEGIPSWAKKEFYIENIYRDNEKGIRGSGLILLKKIIEHAKRNSVDIITLKRAEYSGEKLRNYYTRIGFVDVGEKEPLGMYLDLRINEPLEKIDNIIKEQIKLADGTNTKFDGNNPDIRFEDGGEITPYISDDFQIGYNGAYEHLLAPNGKLSKLTPEQYKLVRTPEFKAWFGDWENDPENASKVVDENGEPLVVYHGSEKEFNVFKSKTEVKYFAKNKEYAEEFGDKIYECFLNIRKLLNAEKFYLNEVSLEELKNFLIQNGIDVQINKNDKKYFSKFWLWVATDNNIVDKIKLKYDGLSMYENYETTYGEVSENDLKTKDYCCFYPNQIKLADGTNTTFDSNNPDIRFEKGGNVIINPKEIECQRCHWQWDVKKGGNDLFICHKCNFDNSKYYTFVDLKKPLTIENNFLKNEGKTISQTPAPKKDKIYGSDINKEGSSKDLKSAKKIELSDTTIEAIKNKVEQHNEKYPNKKISIDSAKAVVRRGMGAYSSSHRPTITDNKPNNRVAWGLARLNAFTYKIINGKSKSGKYNQDDDLIKELNIRLETGGSIKQKTEMKEFKHKFNDGGNVPKSNKMFHLPLELVVYVPSTKDVDKIISKQEMKERVDEVKNYLGKAFGGYSSVKVEGGYVANDGDLVNESITKVVSFASKEDYEKNKNELVSKMTQWSEKWGQEAIGFEFEGDLYYVPEKLKKGGRISHPTFDKLKKKMIMKKGGGVYEGWGFNDRIKILMKGTKSNILKSFKELNLLFPTDDKEIIQDKTIEIFIKENDLKKIKKIANYNNLTILYEAGGEIDYSTGWNNDYENDPIVKAQKKTKELAVRGALAYATAGRSEVARVEGQGIKEMSNQMQPQPGQTGQPDQNQMLMQMAQSGAFGKMAKGGNIDYSKGGNHNLSNQELKSLETAFNRFADKERSVILKRGGLTSKQQNKISTVMHEFKQGELHSGSKKGPIVTNREQAIAIALSEADVKRKRK